MKLHGILKSLSHFYSKITFNNGLKTFKNTLCASYIRQAKNGPKIRRLRCQYYCISNHSQNSIYQSKSKNSPNQILTSMKHKAPQSKLTLPFVITALTPEWKPSCLYKNGATCTFEGLMSASIRPRYKYSWVTESLMKPVKMLEWLKLTTPNCQCLFKYHNDPPKKTKIAL